MPVVSVSMISSHFAFEFLAPVFLQFLTVYDVALMLSLVEHKFCLVAQLFVVPLPFFHSSGDDLVIFQQRFASLCF